MSQCGVTYATVDNIGSLSMGWNPVGPAGPRFLFERGGVDDVDDPSTSRPAWR